MSQEAKRIKKMSRKDLLIEMNQLVREQDEYQKEVNALKSQLNESERRADHWFARATTQTTCVEGLEAQLAAKDEQIAVLTEALEFYSGDFDGREGSRWIDDRFFIEDKFGATYSDGGKRARQALAKVRGEG